MKVHHHDDTKSTSSSKNKSKGSSNLELRCKSKEESLIYHKLSFEELKHQFSTSVDDGLDYAFAQELLAKHGKNLIHSPHPNVILKLLGYLFTG